METLEWFLSEVSRYVLLGMMTIVIALLALLVLYAAAKVITFGILKAKDQFKKENKDGKQS